MEPEKKDDLFEEEALERTFIRAKLGGKWGACSFKTLSETQEGRDILRKYLHGRIEDLFYETDLHDGKRCSNAHWAVNVARLIEHLFGPLVKIKKEVFDERKEP